jgi:hypothetical protein
VSDSIEVGDEHATKPGVEDRIDTAVSKSEQARRPEFVFFGILFCLAAVCILAAQVGWWLYSGDWTAMPVSWALDWAGLAEWRGLHLAESWQGLAKVCLWLLNLPLSAVLFVLGFVTILSE